MFLSSILQGIHPTTIQPTVHLETMKPQMKCSFSTSWKMIWKKNWLTSNAVFHILCSVADKGLIFSPVLYFLNYIIQISCYSGRHALSNTYIHTQYNVNDIFVLDRSVYHLGWYQVLNMPFIKSAIPTRLGCICKLHEDTTLCGTVLAWFTEMLNKWMNEYVMGQSIHESTNKHLWYTAQFLLRQIRSVTLNVYWKYFF